MLSRLALAVVLAVLACPHAAARGSAQAGARVVAIGDIHGAADELTRILRAAALVDEKGRWAGGRARLVQTGDFTDRGERVRDVMDLLMRLESEARRAGGRVDVLFGNHEGMNVLRDFRDVSPRAYAAFADRRSEERRQRGYEAHAAIAKARGLVLERDAWMAKRPPGYLEYVEALSPQGRYGRWIRERKAIVQIDGSVFMHAGLAPGTAASIQEVNRRIEDEVRSWDTLVGVLERQRLATPAFTLQDIVDAAQVEIGKIVEAGKTGSPVAEYVSRAYVESLQRLGAINTWALIDAEGPLWYRGFASPEDDTLRAGLEALLTRAGAERFVTGHTPQTPEARIARRFGGRVFLIDTGMLGSHYKGQPSALEIQDGRITAIYPAAREVLQER